MAILVGEDEYLQGLVRSIHHNPLKAGMVKTLEEYPWSSHLGYLQRGDAWEWLHTGPLLAQFSDDPVKARAEYRRFMARDDDENIERVFSLKKLPVILGNSEFVQTIKDRFFATKLSPEVPQSRQLAPVTAQDIRKAVCIVYDVEEGTMKSSSRGITNEPRDVAMNLARTLRGDSLNHIAAGFEIEKYSTVSSAISRIKLKIEADNGLADRVERSKREIEKRQRKICDPFAFTVSPEARKPVFLAQWSSFS